MTAPNTITPNGAHPLEEPSAAEPLRLEANGNGIIYAVRDGKSTRVKPIPCFPWSDPSRHISLRDDENNEVALVGDLEGLDVGSRDALLGALAQTRFILEIEEIHSIDEEFEIRNWKVRTRQGPCTFQSKIQDWPRQLNRGGILVRDVSGNLFYVPDPASLDKKSHALIWPLVD